MRHFAHHIGDYAAATAHLSFIEDAAYHRLLRRYYQDEKALPADPVAVSRLVGARTKEERQAVANVLTEFFALSDDGYHQSRADKEIEAYRVKAEIARRNGTNGGRPHNQQKTHPVNPSVHGEKLTTNHEPVTTERTTAKAVEGARAPTAKRAARLAPTWRPDDAGRSFAADCGLDPDSTADAFADYWTAASGRTSAKLDWNAAFRTWCRRDRHGPVGQAAVRSVQPSRGGDAFFDQLSLIASRASADERDRN